MSQFMILKSKNSMKFLDYIFYRFYINMYKTKYKDDAEPRAIQFVMFYPLFILFDIIIIADFIFDIYEAGQSVSRGTMAIFAIPIVWIVWHFVEKYYRKYSKDNYQVLRKRFENSMYNKLIPFWLIFIFPFFMLLGVPFILSLLK